MAVYPDGKMLPTTNILNQHEQQKTKYTCIKANTSRRSFSKSSPFLLLGFSITYLFKFPFQFSIIVLFYLQLFNEFY